MWKLFMFRGDLVVGLPKSVTLVFALGTYDVGTFPWCLSLVMTLGAKEILILGGWCHFGGGTRRRYHMIGCMIFLVVA
jgi:hypothetical protein